MDFKELNYVLAIAKHQSITKAANALYLSQPTLTKFLQQLEHSLGQKLFNRIGKKFVLTYAGERYISTASEILTLKNNLDQELADIAQAKIGVLRIGFSSIRGSQIILNIIPPFVSLHPHVQLKFEEISTASFEPMLLSGDLDLVFFNLPIQNPNIDYQFLAYEEVVLVSQANHPLVSMAKNRIGCHYPWVDLRWIEDDIFIMPSPELRLHSIAVGLLKEAGISPNISFYTKNIGAACILASEGHGLTFCGEQHICHTKFDHPPELFSIGTPSTRRTFVAAYRKGSYLANYTQDLIDLVKANPEVQSPSLRWE